MCPPPPVSLIAQPHYLPVEAQLLHGPVDLGHDVVGSALAPDAQVPLGLLHRQRFGPGGVESVQRAARLGAVGQQRGHPLWVGLDPRGQRHALFDEGALGRAGGQVELAGLGHDAPVVYDEVVGNGQLILQDGGSPSDHSHNLHRNVILQCSAEKLRSLINRFLSM